MKNGPASMSYADCTSTTGTCTIVGNDTVPGTAVAAGSLFTMTIVGNGTADSDITFEFIKTDSSLVQTRTQTINADYFKSN